MKKSIYIVALLLCSTGIIAQSTTQNYVLTRTYQTADGTSYLDGIQYFDGLGRPIEMVQKGISPTGGDLVSLTEYDGVGREYKKWLPIVYSGNNGAYVAPTTIIGESPKSYYNYDNKSYTTTDYEPSPLNRVTGKYGAGASWYAAKKNDSILYQTNIASEAAISYFYVYNSNSLARDANNYAPNTLYKTQTMDEDGKTSTEYKDKQGHVVLKRSSSNVDTYYVYNDLGQLSYVLPPIATDSLPANGVISDTIGVLKRYAYLYKYDERGNNTLKRLPGCDTINMVYDKADRLILSQNGNQRIVNSHKSFKQWTVTKYDAFGRVLYTATINRDIQSSEKKKIKNSVITENFDGSFGFYNTGYTCTNFSGELKPLIVNYYDSYTFRKLQTQIDSTKLIYATLSGFDAQYINAKGLLTGTRTYILDKTGNYLVNAFYYDSKGRMVQGRGSNQSGGYDIVYNHYNFTGRLITYRKEHNTSFQTMVPEVYSYNYDNAGRPTTTYYQYTTKPTVIFTNQLYDDIGRLITKYRYGNTDTVSYSYNLRNWITSIKNASFQEELFYNTSNLCASLSPCYNGNIAASTWTYNGVKKAYVYTYDQLNRLTLGTGYQTSGCSLYAPNNREQFNYDKQGNIIRLWRDRDYTNMDFLQMNYVGNQVKSVFDGGIQQNLSSVKEYINGANLATEFKYDQNGNMTKDFDRGIATIRYNLLNLPDTIQFSTGNQIINRYAADGRKLGTEYFTRLVNTIIPMDKDTVCNWTYQSGVTNQNGTIYIGNIEYQTLNGSPYNLLYMKFKNPEGYSNKFIMYYNRYDHLGNVREVWSASQNTVYQRTQYYPGGLPWAATTDDKPGAQPYKYNNKEFVEMHGFDTYDYGARGYYPAMGRFMSVDPLCEKYYSISPYAYCAGNPVRFIDPNGMVIDSISQSQWDEQKQAVWNKIGNLVKNNTNSENDDRIASLQGSLSNMKTLEQSDQVYSLATASGDEGQVRLDVSTGKIVIEFKGTANFVHEITHGAQYENGEIGFDKNTGQSVAQDLWDEAAAYKAQYNYNPSSIATVNRASEITPLWVQGITLPDNTKPYGPEGVFHTGQSPLNLNSGGSAIIYAYSNLLNVGLKMLGFQLCDITNFKFKTR